MKILALNGSPRKKGNSAILLNRFLKGAEFSGAETDEEIIEDLNIRGCSGCLRCNLIKRCYIRDDYWNHLSNKINKADTLVFSAPVYFHHFPANIKKVIDRFRSFFHVKITENGLIHTPWEVWKKNLVLITSMGSPDQKDAKPMVDLLKFMVNEMGVSNRLYVLAGTRLAIPKQISMSLEELEILYKKLDIPVSLAADDHIRNKKLLKKSYNLGVKLGKRTK
ncbi:MAG: flavodoxin family protein [Acidobacteriota bacterium]